MCWVSSCLNGHEKASHAERTPSPNHVSDTISHDFCLQIHDLLFGLMLKPETYGAKTLFSESSQTFQSWPPALCWTKPTWKEKKDAAKSHSHLLGCIMHTSFPSLIHHPLHSLVPCTNSQKPCHSVGRNSRAWRGGGQEGRPCFHVSRDLFQGKANLKKVLRAGNKRKT